MAPDAGGVMRKIPAEVLVEPGWALARFGDGGWWPALERGLESGEFPEDVVQAMADVVRRAGGVDWITSVPSVRLATLSRGWGPHRRGAVRPIRRARGSRGRAAATARDGQRRPAGRQRPGRVQNRGHAAPGAGRAARRPPHLGLDARDGRRSAPPRRRRARTPARARHTAVACWRRQNRRERSRVAISEGGDVESFHPCQSGRRGGARRGHGGVASASPVDAHAAQATVPIVIVKTRSGATAALVRVFIHGRLIPMLIDTGATVSVINQTAARHLHLKTIGKRHRFCGVTGCALASRVRVSNWNVDGMVPLPRSSSRAPDRRAQRPRVRSARVGRTVAVRGGHDQLRGQAADPGLNASLPAGARERAPVGAGGLPHSAVNPPSTGSATPVMNDACSEAKNRAAARIRRVEPAVRAAGRSRTRGASAPGRAAAQRSSRASGCRRCPDTRR